MVGFACCGRRLEGAVDELASKIAGTNDTFGRIIFKTLPIERKIQILRELGPPRYAGSSFEPVEETLSKINFLREDRNLVIHGQWFTSMPSCEPYAFGLRPQSKKPFDIVGESFPPSRMASIISQVAALHDEVASHIRTFESLPQGGGE